MNIPAFQNQSPAGHPDLPYLPSCIQLEARPGGAEGWNGWGPVIDGEHQNWHGIPSSWDTTQSYEDLEAWGFCTTQEGSITVPFIAVSEQGEESPETENWQGFQTPGNITQRLEESTPNAGEENQQDSSIPGNITKRLERQEQQQSQPIVEVPGNFVKNREQVQTEVAADPASSLGSVIIGMSVCLGGGVFALQKIARNMTAAQLANAHIDTTTTSENIFEEEEEIYNQERVPAPTVSHTPVMQVQAEAPPWEHTPTHAGTVGKQAFPGLETVGKRTGSASQMYGNIPGSAVETSGNEAETLRKFQNRMILLHSGPETKVFSPQMSENAPETNGNGTETSGSAVETEWKYDLQKGTHNPVEFNERLAKALYFSLREEGVSTAKHLGWAIFGIDGGRNWNDVSGTLDQWNSEWEEQNA